MELGRQAGTTALTRPPQSSADGRQDVEPWARACSPLDASKLKARVPLSAPYGTGSGRCSPLGQVPPPPLMAATCGDPHTDPQSGALKKGDHRPSSMESQCGGPAEGPRNLPTSVLPDNIRHKFGNSMVDQVESEKQAQKALSDVLEGQKNVNTRLGRSQSSVQGPPSYADYYDLGYNSRSNLFQGATQEVMSLMKASYTPEVIEKSVRDMEHWHGRKTDDLGRWHQKNLMEMNLQKALEEKQGEKGRKSLKS